MRILITNDDGIHAPGLAVLEKIARALSDDVWTVAPEYDQSGVSHSMSLSDPLRLRQISAQSFAIKGTPTDCVIMGVRSILADKPPDLVLSGVNLGQNVAEDVTYSGTIAGAMEGTVLGFPSIALSQAYGLVSTRATLDWDCAEVHGAAVVDKILQAGIPKDVLINVNFPDCRGDEVQGVAVTMQGKRQCALLHLEERADGRGVPYYWLVFSRNKVVAEQGTDLQAMIDRNISVTPLRMDLTDEPTVTKLAAAFDASDEQARKHAGAGVSAPEPGSGAHADPSGFVATAEFLLRLRSRGIRDLAVLRAIERVPRHVFVPHRYADLATRDVALPIGCGQTMADPFALARMLEALELKPEHRVLEIGTGSGFAAAVMARLCAQVLSIERFQTLAVEARTRLEQLQVDNVAVVWADGAALPPQAGMFDRIVVEALVDTVPAAWRAALAPHGRLLMARRKTDGTPAQCVVVATPVEDCDWVERPVTRSRLQPLLDGVSQGL